MRIDISGIHFLRIFLLFGVTVFQSSSVPGQIWTVLGLDRKGDARDQNSADLAQVSYSYDREKDYLQFRITLYGNPDKQVFGVNIALDTGADEQAKLSWWGGNKGFKFDKLVTAWVTLGPKGYEGTIGVGDASGVKTGRLDNLFQNDIQISVENDSIVLGLRRSDITDKTKMNVVAAVGSNERWSDDLPNTGSVPIDLAAPRPVRNLREIDLSRNNFKFPTGYKVLPPQQSPQIRRYGRGKQTLILIPGMYSSNTFFDGFIKRNQSNCIFYVLIPPGMFGTPARPMPTDGPRLRDRLWTQLLERDIGNLIRKHGLKRPVILTGGNPGSQAAIEFANQHPNLLGGIILTGNYPVQFYPSPKDPSRKTPATLEERETAVSDGWADKWFKYVTPETWVSNDMPPAALSSDPTRGQQAFRDIEAAPLEVKIRYLCEFWDSDVSGDLANLQVPILAVVPTYDEKFFADPTNASAKTALVDSWKPLPTINPNVQLVWIPNARALIFDDQPDAVDKAIAAFVQKVSESAVP